MPEQPPAERIRNFREVPHGYTPLQAVAEARAAHERMEARAVAGKIVLVP